MAQQILVVLLKEVTDDYPPILGSSAFGQRQTSKPLAFSSCSSLRRSLRFQLAHERFHGVVEGFYHIVRGLFKVPAGDTS
jgi:hypothetical protein